MVTSTVTSDEPAVDLGAAAIVFNDVRPRLFGLAYRIVGSAAEAEDVVQDAWLRWQNCDRTVVENPAAYLSTTTTRLALTVLDSARVRRETYIGPWLPEPVDTSADPLLGAERGEALGLAVLLLMEKLGPVERAAYVLRESFEYPYRDIARILETTEASARQSVSRAKKRIGDGRTRPVDQDEHRKLLNAFVDAAQNGNVEALTSLFSSDVVSLSDGGGVAGVLAARIPILGADRVGKFVASFSSHFWTGADVTSMTINGAAAVVLSRDGVPYTVLAIETNVDGIAQILWVMNPSKLTFLR